MLNTAKTPYDHPRTCPPSLSAVARSSLSASRADVGRASLRGRTKIAEKSARTREMRELTTPAARSSVCGR